MSNVDRFRQIVREIVLDEIKKMNETSGTGGVAGYDTPNAFSKDGKVHAPKLPDGWTVESDVEDKLKEELKESFYFRDSHLSSPQKIGLAIKEARLNLGRAERLVNRAMTLQQESNSPLDEEATATIKNVGLQLRRLNERASQLMIILNNVQNGEAK